MTFVAPQLLLSELRLHTSDGLKTQLLRSKLRLPAIDGLKTQLLLSGLRLLVSVDSRHNSFSVNYASLRVVDSSAKSLKYAKQILQSTATALND